MTILGHSMGGQALMQFTKRYDSSEIQSTIDRIVIIDIPTTPIMNGLNYKKTRDMIHNLQQISMKQSLRNIHQ